MAFKSLDKKQHYHFKTYGYWDAYNPAIRRPFHHLTHVGFYPSPSVREVFSRDFWRRTLNHPFLTPEGAEKRFVCQRCEAKRSVCFVVSAPFHWDDGMMTLNIRFFISTLIGDIAALKLFSSLKAIRQTMSLRAILRNRVTPFSGLVTHSTFLIEPSSIHNVDRKDKSDCNRMSMVGHTLVETT